MKCMAGGAVLFEAESAARGFKEIAEDRFEYMLKQLRQDRSDCNCAIVICISMVTFMILQHWNHEAMAKLSGQKCVPKHHIKVGSETYEKIKWSIMQMLS